MIFFKIDFQEISHFQDLVSINFLKVVSFKNQFQEFVLCRSTVFIVVNRHRPARAHSFCVCQRKGAHKANTAVVEERDKPLATCHFDTAIWTIKAKTTLPMISISSIW